MLIVTACYADMCYMSQYLRFVADTSGGAACKYYCSPDEALIDYYRVLALTSYERLHSKEAY